MNKNINTQAIEIQKRFFEAIALAQERGLTRSIKSFCLEHNLNFVKYYRLKVYLGKPIEDMHYKTIDIDALMYLCNDFGVSSDWLLLGRGELNVR